MSCVSAPLAAVEAISASLFWLRRGAPSEFDSEFPWLSLLPVLINGSSWVLCQASLPLGLLPLVLTPLPHHLLLWVKNDQRDSVGFSVLGWRAEPPREGRGGFCPQWTVSQHLLLMVSPNLPPNYPPLIAPSYHHTGHDLDIQGSKRAILKLLLVQLLFKSAAREQVYRRL